MAWLLELVARKETQFNRSDSEGEVENKKREIIFKKWLQVQEPEWW